MIGIDAHSNPPSLVRHPACTIGVGQIETLHQVVARRIHPVLVVGHHRIDAVQPRPIDCGEFHRLMWWGMAVSMASTAMLVSTEKAHGWKMVLTRSAYRLMNRRRKGVVQDVVEQLTVYAGKSGVARRFNVIVVNASAKEAKPCIGIVEQVGPAAFGRGAEDLGVVQAPAMPIQSMFWMYVSKTK